MYNKIFGIAGVNFADSELPKKEFKNSTKATSAIAEEDV
jgi:hypothetical protein